MKLATVFALAATCAGSTPTPLDELAGEYRNKKVIEMVAQPPEQAEDVLTIIKTGPSTAFVEMTLSYHNGHFCSIIGIADTEGDALIYREPEPLHKDRPCALEIRRVGDRIVFRDENAACELSNCGARGHFGDVTLPVTSRAPIANPAERLGPDSNYFHALEQYRRLDR